MKNKFAPKGREEVKFLSFQVGTSQGRNMILHRMDSTEIVDAANSVAARNTYKVLQLANQLKKNSSRFEGITKDGQISLSGIASHIQVPAVREWLLKQTKDPKIQTVSALRSKWKGQQPLAYWSGIFTGSERPKNATLSEATGFLMLDCDTFNRLSVEDQEEAESKIYELPYVYHIRRTTSNNLRAVIQFDHKFQNKGTEAAKEFRLVAGAIFEQMEEITGLKFDKACLDITRGDYLNYSATPYYFRPENELESFPVDSDLIYNKLAKKRQQEIERAANRPKDLPELEPENYELVFELARKRADERFGEYGTESRHHYVFGYFGNYLNRYGMPFELALDYCREHFPALDRDNQRAITLAYDKGIDNHKTWSVAKKARTVDWLEGLDKGKQLKVKKYVGEDMQIFSRICKDSKVLLQAPAGSGKSSAARRMAMAKAEQGKSTVFIFPTTLLAEQQQAQFEKDFGIRLPALHHKASKTDRQASQTAPIVMTTLDSFQKVAHREWSLAVIDEIDQLIEWRNIKKSKLTKARETLEQTSDCIMMMSATPPDAYTLLGYRKYSITQTERADRSILRPVRSDMDQISTACEMMAERGNLAVLFVNRIADQERAKHTLISLDGDESSIGILNSTMKGTDLYQQIVTEKRIPEGIKYLIINCMMEAGQEFWNIGFDDSYLIQPTIRQIVQVPQRARNSQQREVFVFAGEHTPKDQQTALECFRRLTGEAERNISAAAQNRIGFGRLTEAGNNYPYVSECSFTGDLSIDYEWIFWRMELERNSQSSLNEKIQAVVQGQPYYQVGKEYIHKSKRRDITEDAKKTSREKRQEEKEAAIKSILEAPQTVLNAIIATTGDEMTRDRILAVSPDNDKQPTQEDQQLFRAGGIAYRMAMLLVRVMEQGVLIPEDAATIKREFGIKDSRTYNKWKRGLNLIGYENGMEGRGRLAEAELSTLLAVKNHFRKLVGQKLTGEEILNQYNSVRGIGHDDSSRAKAVRLVGSMFDLKRQRTNTEDLPSLVRRLERSITSGEQTVKKWSSDDSKNGKRNYKSAQKRLDANRAKLTEARDNLKDWLPGEDDSPAHCYLIREELNLEAYLPNGVKLLEQSILFAIQEADRQVVPIRENDTSVGTLSDKTILYTTKCTGTYVTSIPATVDEWEGYTPPAPDEVAPF